jgi:hypothetical protein
MNNERLPPRRKYCFSVSDEGNAVCVTRPKASVIGQAVAARGIGDLLNLARQVINVIHARGIGITFVREAIQRVIHVQDGLVLAIDLAGEIAQGIVNIIFIQRRGERCLREPAKRVIHKCRGVLSSVSNAGEIILQIVCVMGCILRRVSNAGQTVGVIISVSCDFAVLVGYGSAAATRVMSEAGECCVSDSYTHPLLRKGVGHPRYRGGKKQLRKPGAPGPPVQPGPPQFL